MFPHRKILVQNVLRWEFTPVGKRRRIFVPYLNNAEPKVYITGDVGV